MVFRILENRLFFIAEKNKKRFLMQIDQETWSRNFD